MSRTDGVLTTDAQPHMDMCVHTGRSRNPGRGWPRGPGGVPGSQQHPARRGAPAPPRRRRGAGTDRDDGGAGVLQAQEQGQHALVHLGSQPAQLPACHRRHQVPEQCHGRCPDPVPLLQDRGLEPSQTLLGTLHSGGTWGPVPSAGLLHRGSRLQEQTSASPLRQALGQGCTSPSDRALRQDSASPLRQGSWKDSASPLRQGSGQNSASPLRQGSGAGMHLPLRQGSGQDSASRLRQGSGQGCTSPSDRALGRTQPPPSARALGQDSASPLRQGSGQGCTSPLTHLSGQGCASHLRQLLGRVTAILRDLHSFLSHACGCILTTQVSRMLTWEGRLLPLTCPEGESVIHRGS